MKGSTQRRRAGTAISAGALWLAVALAWMLAPLTAAAQTHPNVGGSMAGVPLPVGDLPDRTVSVRVVRDALTDNLVDHPVELHAGGRVIVVRTDANGRATFADLPAGAEAHVVTTLDDMRLESGRFTVPAQGGLRLLLGAMARAGGPEAAADPTAPPVPGTVFLSAQSHIAIEMGEDQALDVYLLLEIANEAQAPVVTAEPLIVEAPAAATHVRLLEGSSPQATVGGLLVRVAGPFAPGRTPVRIGYQVAYQGGRLRLSQRLPADLELLSVVMARVGGAHFTSQRFDAHWETVAEGKPYLVANGPGIAAGETLEIDLTGLPHHNPLPRAITLVLAFAMVAAGAWAWVGAPAARRAGRQRLLARREQLVAELVRIEERRQGGRPPGRQTARRRDLMARIAGIDRELHAES